MREAFSRAMTPYLFAKAGNMKAQQLLGMQVNPILTSTAQALYMKMQASAGHLTQAPVTTTRQATSTVPPTAENGAFTIAVPNLTTLLL